MDSNFLIPVNNREHTFLQLAKLLRLRSKRFGIPPAYATKQFTEMLTSYSDTSQSAMPHSHTTSVKSLFYTLNFKIWNVLLISPYSWRCYLRNHCFSKSCTLRFLLSRFKVLMLIPVISSTCENEWVSFSFIAWSSCAFVYVGFLPSR